MKACRLGELSDASCTGNRPVETRNQFTVLGAPGGADDDMGRTDGIIFDRRKC